MYLLYSILYTIALIFIFPFEYFKRPKDVRKRWVREKFGFFNPSFTSHFSSPIWIHAVSVGEVMAALPLLKKLRERYPLNGFILSTITDTGQKVARENAPKDTAIVYLPFDLAPVLNSVLKIVSPEILIVIETELWPNLIRVFKEKGMPVVLLNGRISGDSFRGYKKISFFMKRILAGVDLFGMQDGEYAERIRLLGVDDSRIRVIGNFKFDSSPPSSIPEWAEKIRGPVIVAGSTHEGEEEMITSVYLGLTKDFRELNLIIAPRHPERFSVVEEMLKSKGITYVKRSDLGGQDLKSGYLAGEIIILDTVGELSAVYGISDVAIVGKSFRGYGGQNPLEPAYWGKPIICGPHMENFPVIRDFYTAGAALEVNEEGLYLKLRECLMAPEKAKEIGSKAQELYRNNAGAVDRAIDIIEGYIHK
jgi:3-deoxy-D-manno-octulosonic-acid transferase